MSGDSYQVKQSGWLSFFGGLTGRARATVINRSIRNSPSPGWSRDPMDIDPPLLMSANQDNVRKRRADPELRRVLLFGASSQNGLDESIGNEGSEGGSMTGTDSTEPWKKARLLPKSSMETLARVVVQNTRESVESSSSTMPRRDPNPNACEPPSWLTSSWKQGPQLLEQVHESSFSRPTINRPSSAMPNAFRNCAVARIRRPTSAFSPVSSKTRAILDRLNRIANPHLGMSSFRISTRPERWASDVSESRTPVTTPPLSKSLLVSRNELIHDPSAASHRCGSRNRTLMGLEEKLREKWSSGQQSSSSPLSSNPKKTLEEDGQNQRTLSKGDPHGDIWVDASDGGESKRKLPPAPAIQREKLGQTTANRTWMTSLDGGATSHLSQSVMETSSTETTHKQRSPKRRNAKNVFSANWSELGVAVQEDTSTQTTDFETAQDTQEYKGLFQFNIPVRRGPSSEIRTKAVFKKAVSSSDSTQEEEHKGQQKETTMMPLKSGPKPPTDKLASSLGPAPSTFPSTQIASARTTWTCKECWVSNQPDKQTCLACGTIKDGLATNGPAIVSTADSNSKSWSCNDCFVSNTAGVTKCIVCGGARPGTAPSEKTGGNVFGDKTFKPMAPAAGAPTFGFGTATSGDKPTIPRFGLGAPTSETVFVAGKTGTPSAPSSFGFGDLPSSKQPEKKEDSKTNAGNEKGEVLGAGTGLKTAEGVDKKSEGEAQKAMQESGEKIKVTPTFGMLASAASTTVTTTGLKETTENKQATNLFSGSFLTNKSSTATSATAGNLPQTTSTPSFGFSSTAKQTILAFGTTGSGIGTTPPAVTTAATVPPSAGLFTFGAASSAKALADFGSASTPAFNTAGASNTTIAAYERAETGEARNAVKRVFSFTVPPATSAAQPLFSFGAAAALTATATAMPAATGSLFGSVAPQDGITAAASSGATSTTPTGLSLGATAAPVTKRFTLPSTVVSSVPAAFNFGSTSLPDLVAPGALSTPFNFGTANTDPPATFSFGASTPSTAPGTFSFAAQAPAAAPPAFGAPAPTTNFFSLGSAAPTGASTAARKMLKARRQRR